MTGQRADAGLFITGTDTGVGKTHIASALVRLLSRRGVRVGAYKPVASGACMVEGTPVWQDVEALAAALGQKFPRQRIGPQCFIAPAAPNVAARLEGRSVDRHLLLAAARWWRGQVEFLVVEGAGGLLCPVTNELTMADLARDLGYPLLIVARATLGTINHTLLTIEAARHRGLAIAGVLLNQAAPPAPDDVSVATNAEQISRLGKVNCLACLPFLSQQDLLDLPQFHTINWQALAQVSCDT